MEDLKEKALKAIRNSCSAEFLTPLSWGQWCRSVAEAALDRDADELADLLDEATEKEQDKTC